MIIANIAKKAINSFATKTAKVARTNMHMSIPQAKKLTGLSQDVFEKAQKLDFTQIKLGKRINSGREANVFEILGTNDYVLRIKKDLDFSPKLLKGLIPTDKIDDITVASNADESIKVLKRIMGEPLYGKDWNIHKDPNISNYFACLTRLELASDKVFVNYLKDVIELRKKGLDIDDINPNNYLYDVANQKINIIDVSKKTSKKNALTLDDLSPLVDGHKIGHVYSQLDNQWKQKFIKRLQTFIDRIVSSAKKEGIEVEIEAIDKTKLQSTLTYLYHNDKQMLKLL
jgi:hypothetical protein